ncbi:MAG: translation initiation factor IF-2, partial [Candidatus Aenigmarchaeota archaeon]|nr:translation initiation factor IF-2 [Candidatus Aenigmarchaeota archaeon]
KIEQIKKELQMGIEDIEFEKSIDGIILKADNLGSLEALIGMFEKKVPVKSASIGSVLRKDVIISDAVRDPLMKVIVAFNSNVDDSVISYANDNNIKIIKSNIIYKLIEDYEAFVDETKERIKQEKLETITLPAKVKLIPGHVFRANNPAIVGVEIIAGKIKAGYKLQKDGKEIGYIKTIQSDAKTLDEAKPGDKVALSIDGPTVGRHIREGDELATLITKKDLKVLEELNLKEELALARSILEN